MCFGSCLGAEVDLPYCQSCSGYFKNLGPYLWGKNDQLGMLNIVLKIWSVLLVFMLCYDTSKLFAVMTREKFVF